MKSKAPENCWIKCPSNGFVQNNLEHADQHPDDDVIERHVEVQHLLANWKRIDQRRVLFDSSLECSLPCCCQQSREVEGALGKDIQQQPLRRPKQTVTSGGLPVERGRRPRAPRIKLGGKIYEYRNRRCRSWWTPRGSECPRWQLDRNILADP